MTVSARSSTTDAGGAAHGVRRPRAGVVAALAALGVVAAVGLAGTAAGSRAQDATIDADDGTEFSPSNVGVQPGEKVTWIFNNPNTPHNVAARPDSPTPWTLNTTIATDHPPVERTFAQDGTYTFYCAVHGGMQGTVTVGAGAPTPTPTATATPTASPSATPTPAPSATPTPPPHGGSSNDDADTIPPRVRGLRASFSAGVLRVRFRASERMRVTVKVTRRGSRRAVRTARATVQPGGRILTVRLRQARPGRYRIDLSGRDLAGNRAHTESVSVRIERRA